MQFIYKKIQNVCIPLAFKKWRKGLPVIIVQEQRQDLVYRLNQSLWLIVFRQDLGIHFVPSFLLVANFGVVHLAIWLQCRAVNISFRGSTICIAYYTIQEGNLENSSELFFSVEKKQRERNSAAAAKCYIYIVKSQAVDRSTFQF